MRLVFQAIAVCAASLVLSAQEAPAPPPPCSAFDPSAETALKAMRARAGELHIKGVAVVAYAQGR